ncbi:tetratricopeptide repeat protein [Corticibacter populi]|nr:tetratricopeptide repeat protein [Corticibacter populi]RZS33014.1 tetratricopeptide repeat protein [Corticibacter populi]
MSTPSSSLPLPVRRLAGLLALLLALSLAAAAAQAQTAQHVQIAQWLANGQAEQALAAAEAGIAEFPRDPQLQFLKANAESALGRQGDAEKTLTDLTQQYPELPEPWNNLAAIRAGQGRLEEARSLLEEALRSNPNYAQAHANLADVLLRLADGHLQTAQELAPSAAQAQQIEALRPLLDANAQQPR